MIEVQVGDNLYAPLEGWSGKVTRIVYDDDGEPASAVLMDHDPHAPHPWIAVDLRSYRRSRQGEIGYH